MRIAASNARELSLDRTAQRIFAARPGFTARVGTPLCSTYAQDSTLAREIIGAFGEMWDRAEHVVARAAAVN